MRSSGFMDRQKSREAPSISAWVRATPPVHVRRRSSARDLASDTTDIVTRGDVSAAANAGNWPRGFASRGVGEPARLSAVDQSGVLTLQRPMTSPKVPPEGLADDPYAGERFIRVVGRRRRPEIGEVPTKEVREAMSALPRAGVRAPKGVFRYWSHEEANRDWETWLAQSMAETAE